MVPETVADADPAWPVDRAAMIARTATSRWFFRMRVISASSVGAARAMTARNRRGVEDLVRQLGRPVWARSFASPSSGGFARSLRYFQPWLRRVPYIA